MTFLYLGKQFYHPRKCLEATLWFRNKLPDTAHKAIEQLIPYPLSLNLRWGEHFLHCSTDDYFSFRVREKFGKKWRQITAVWSDYKAQANAMELKKFYETLDKNLNIIHQKYPILFFYKMKNFENDGTENEYFNTAEIERMQKEVIPVLITAISNSNNHKEKQHIAWLASAFFDYIPFEIDKSFASVLLKLLEKTLPFASDVATHQEIIEKLKGKIA